MKIVAVGLCFVLCFAQTVAACEICESVARMVAEAGPGDCGPCAEIESLPAVEVAEAQVVTVDDFEDFEDDPLDEPFMTMAPAACAPCGEPLPVANVVVPPPVAEVDECPPPPPQKVVEVDECPPPPPQQIVLAKPAMCDRERTYLGFAIGGGQSDSVAVDLFFKHYFKSFVPAEALSLRPLIGTMAFGWFRNHESIYGAAVFGGLNLDFGQGTWRPYTEATFGGAYISKTRFDDRRFGTKFQFRSNLGLGVKFGRNLQHAVQAEISHYSNAGIKKDNSGYTSVGLSYGFCF